MASICFSFTISQDDLAMRFRAGFRRIDIPTPTEYNLQYTWKIPAPDHTPQPQSHTPLLQAENLLNGQRGPSNYPTNQQLPVQNGHHGNGVVGEGEENIQDFEQLELHENTLHVDGIADSAQFCDPKATVQVPKLRIGTDKNSPNTGKSKRAHCSSKPAKKKPKSHRCHHESHHRHTSKQHKGGAGGGRSNRTFVSEYKRQFKAWPTVPSSTGGVKEKEGKADGNKKKEKNGKGKHCRFTLLV